MARYASLIGTCSIAAAAVLAGVILTWHSTDLYSVISRSVQASQLGEQPSPDIPVNETTSQSVQAAEAACRLSGQVVDCGCDFASVERMNHQYLYPLLMQLTKQPFYRFFKVNIYCDCQFWPDSGMCSRIDCAVHECDSTDIPEHWREHDRALEEARTQKSKGSKGWWRQAAQVDRSVDAGVEGKLSAVVDWRALDNPWLPDDETQGSEAPEYVYVDLQRNEEKYTGYKGEDARRIWAAIYDQSVLREAAAQANNATEGAAQVPREQQVLFRLISGMHTSITTSIIKNFYDEETETWGPNLPFFKGRFATPSARPHIENLYFTLLFVLRATTKAGAALSKLDYNGAWSKEQVQRTQQLVDELVISPELQAACPVPFDEGLLWRQDWHGSATLRQQLQTAFHNITRLMDCVGCEKCKLNGKLNMLGIATALKVLFAQPEQPQIEGREPRIAGREPNVGGGEADSTAIERTGGELVLERNEAIALVNFLAKLSDSVETIRSLSERLREQEETAAAAA